MTMPARRTAIAVATAILTLTALPACSSSATASGPPAAPASTPSGEASRAPVPGDGGGAGLTSEAICAALPAAEAKQLSGLDITTAVPAASGSDQAGCGYSSDDSSVQVQVQVFSNDTAQSTWALISQVPSNVSVPGLGDKAVYDGDGTLYAQKGGELLQVNGVATQAQAVALAGAVMSRL